MSKKNDFLLRAVLLALLLGLVALVLGVTIVAQREKSLAESLHAWPGEDAGYETFLRLPEGDAPPLTLLILQGEPESFYLVATCGDRMWVMELAPSLLLKEREGPAAVEELRARGLPCLLEALAGSYALPVVRCISLEAGELAGLLARTPGVSLPLVATGSGSAGGGLPDSRERSLLAGRTLVDFGALWQNLFTPENLYRRHDLQADLAAACRVDSSAGYRTLQEWGSGLGSITSVCDLPSPVSGWEENARELDGPVCAAMFDLMPAGEDALESYLADYRYRKEAERRLHTLSWEPTTPAIIYGGNAGRMEVAITLDDGWNMDWRIIELLDSYGIDCTVFPIGRGVADQHPEWLQALDDLGWEVANHTYTHPISKPTRLIDIPDEAVLAELMTAQQLIYDTTGKKYPYFRPPGGWVDERVAALAGDLGYLTIMWSLDSGDTRNPNASPLDKANTILGKVKPGYILLFHFGGYGTFETLRYLVPEMLAQGYHLVTLTQLFQP